MSVVNAGNGIVASAPGGIACGADCDETFDTSTAVVLTAMPDAGFQVSAWSGCDTVNGSQCTVTMTEDRTVSVTFAPASGPFTLTVAVNQPAGSIGSIIGVQPAGNVINCGGPLPQVCAQSFPAGTVVVVGPSNTSVELALFSGWTGCDSLGPLFTCLVTLTGDRTVTATFGR